MKNTSILTAIIIGILAALGGASGADATSFSVSTGVVAQSS